MAAGGWGEQFFLFCFFFLFFLTPVPVWLDYLDTIPLLLLYSSIILRQSDTKYELYVTKANLRVELVKMSICCLHCRFLHLGV
ncbi:hypothetical protein GGR58DRAFT_258031 [Xylaria digitata]|nr:hypothetical protein GGR58DRAFT_258031 [Xylaria digitata]